MEALATVSTAHQSCNLSTTRPGLPGKLPSLLTILFGLPPRLSLLHNSWQPIKAITKQFKVTKHANGHKKRGGHYHCLGPSCGAKCSWYPQPLGSAPMATERPQSNTWVSQLSWNTAERHQDLMRWQCIVSKASGGSTAAIHSPLIKTLLMGSEEGKPPLTGLTLVQVVKENYFCLRTNLPFSTEILIRVNFKGVAGWH